MRHGTAPHTHTRTPAHPHTRTHSKRILVVFLQKYAPEACNRRPALGAQGKFVSAAVHAQHVPAVVQHRGPLQITPANTAIHAGGVV